MKCNCLDYAHSLRFDRYAKSLQIDEGMLGMSLRSNASSPGPCDVCDTVATVTSRVSLCTRQIMRFLQLLTGRGRDSPNYAEIECYILRMPVFSSAEICENHREINKWLLRGAVLVTSLSKSRVLHAAFTVKILEKLKMISTQFSVPVQMIY